MHLLSLKIFYLIVASKTNINQSRIARNRMLWKRFHIKSNVCSNLCVMNIVWSNYSRHTARPKNNKQLLTIRSILNPVCINETLEWAALTDVRMCPYADAAKPLLNYHNHQAKGLLANCERGLSVKIVALPRTTAHQHTSLIK